MERILGYKPKELVGRTFQDLNILHPDDMGRAFDNAKTYFPEEQPSSDLPFITKEGKTKFGEVSGALS